MAKYNAEQLDALKAKGHTFSGSTSYPIDDEEDLTAAVRAVGRGGADHDAIRRYVIQRAKEMGKASLIPEDWQSDGSLRSEALGESVVARGIECVRNFQLDDISIRSGGDGRTVVAYAAVFNTPAEITDADGHYVETINRTAFEKTLAERSGQILCFYNHGKTIYGTPSERFSMPLGTPEEIRTDERGLLTVTRYNRNQLADEVLESIRNGDIKGHSFSGRFPAARSKRVRGAYGEPDRIERNEVALREYGPTPIPAYKEAALIGVRSLALGELVVALRDCSPDDRAELFRIAETGSVPLSLEDDAARDEGTSLTEPAPVENDHPGPTQFERRQRVAALLDQKGL